MVCPPLQALASSTAARKVQSPLALRQIQSPGALSELSDVLLTQKVSSAARVREKHINNAINPASKAPAESREKTVRKDRVCILLSSKL
jgi:hypothetical protein